MATRRKSQPTLNPDPLWYRDAVIYQIHVRAYYDSNGDGGGDFRGLTEKLDYLRDLGVTALWLLPFYPSPLKDDGYDIADYTDIHRAYGTLRDVEVFLREAHARGLRVITELVVNHTSDQHPWFQRARRAKPGSAWRDFYVWSDTPDKYADARIIFKDFETSNWTWDPVAKAYYWHRFYSHQPDLNFDRPAVGKAVLEALDFWFRLGVDGLRLDAVPYLYEREGTNCENLPETHAFLKSLRRHVDECFQDKMLLAEANQWPEDAAAYFGDGDECHMAFHFPVMPRLFMATHMEDRFPIVDIMEQTPAIPDTAQWAIFLRNHDELTLEMVTDEERDYMYRVYASDPQARINLGIRRRLAPLLGNHRRKIELLNGLLLSLPGTPVIYYGDEIGMGDNIYLGDRNGVRTPMQWSADRNAGFSRANPHRLYLPVVMDSEHNPDAVNVEQQQNNPHSLLWWMKRLIALRKRYAAFGRGTIEFLAPENRRVLAFIRSYQDERLLVVANLSRFVTYAQLDLSAYRGLIPVELFGKTEFPAVGDQHYFLTLGPHAFFWFSLQRPKEASIEVRWAEHDEGVPQIAVRGGWENVLNGPQKEVLESVLPQYLVGWRWFGGKARVVKSVSITEAIRMPALDQVVFLALLRVFYIEGEAETYLLPLAYAEGVAASEVKEQTPGVVLARLHCDGAAEAGILFDAVVDKKFAETVLDAITRRRHFKAAEGELRASPSRVLREIRNSAEGALDIRIMKGEQSNTSIVYGDQLILKLFRRLEEGVNPDLEIGRFLTEKAAFAHIPPVAGALMYFRKEKQPITIGILQAFVPNEGDAWKYTLETLDTYYEEVLARRSRLDDAELPGKSLVDLLDEQPPVAACDTIGAYLEWARLLGQRTGEMHIALASSSEDADFAPEPFSSLYQRSLYQATRSLASQSLELLRKQCKRLPEQVQDDAGRVLDLAGKMDQRLRSIVGQKLTAMRIRCHGDYHLGQVLYTGKDFVILDFEGEPARSLSERRLKRSPLRDVGGMLRSFHYAAYTELFDQAIGGVLRPEDQLLLEPWARLWCVWVSVAFLKAYLNVAGEMRFVPGSREELRWLLDIAMLEKALYELKYELNNRPQWVAIPLKGILELFDGTVETN